MSKRYTYSHLFSFARTLFEKTGLAADRAEIMSRILITSDLMGHTTHGLQLLVPYLRQLEEGHMTLEGEPEIIRDKGNSVTWDGRFLPGPYLVEKAVDLGFERLEQDPVFCLAIQNSHHIACLAAYLERATDRGYVIILGSSDPGNRTVSPFGGLTGVYSPDPLSYGIPTKGEPILFDSSASTLANGQIMQRHAAGQMLEGAWLQRPDGSLTDDPSAFFEVPPATILPLGGLTLGFKGFGHALLMEALTSGLSGSGRRTPLDRWRASVYLQMIDPDGFGGRETFLLEMQYLVDQCRASTPHPSHGQPVRIPGERALSIKRKQIEEGILLHPEVIRGLEKCAEKYGVDF